MKNVKKTNESEIKIPKMNFIKLWLFWEKEMKVIDKTFHNFMKKDKETGVWRRKNQKIR